MVSMAFSYFYSYQTYAIDNFKEGAEKSSREVVVGVELREVLNHVVTKIEVLKWPCCIRLQTFIQPLFDKAEQLTGKGGSMGGNVSGGINQFDQTCNTADVSRSSGVPEWSEDEEEGEGAAGDTQKPYYEMKSALSTMTPIIEEDSQIISDSMSNFTDNSRNFQMPEKDFILEINKQKQMLNITLDNEEEEQSDLLQF